MSEEQDQNEAGAVAPWSDVAKNYEEDKNVPYEEIEAPVVDLCKAINEFPGVVTSDSCQGFLEDHRPGAPWHVYFSCQGPVTMEGYASIEFLVWMAREARSEGFDISIGVNSGAPALNGVCESMYFFFQCRNRHPDELATIIRDYRSKFFYVPLA